MDELIGANLAEELLPETRRGAGIASVAAALPQRVVGNEEIAERAREDEERRRREEEEARVPEGN